MHIKAQNTANITPRTLYKDYALITLLFNLSKPFYVFLARQIQGRQTVAKYLR